MNPFASPPTVDFSSDSVARTCNDVNEAEKDGDNRSLSDADWREFFTEAGFPPDEASAFSADFGRLNLTQIDILQFSHGSLKELGITSVGARLKILKMCEQVRQQNVVDDDFSHLSSQMDDLGTGTESCTVSPRRHRPNLNEYYAKIASEEVETEPQIPSYSTIEDEIASDGPTPREAVDATSVDEDESAARKDEEIEEKEDSNQFIIYTDEMMRTKQAVDIFAEDMRAKEVLQIVAAARRIQKPREYCLQPTNSFQILDGATNLNDLGTREFRLRRLSAALEEFSNVQKQAEQLMAEAEASRVATELRNEEAAARRAAIVAAESSSTSSQSGKRKLFGKKLAAIASSTASVPGLRRLRNDTKRGGNAAESASNAQASSNTSGSSNRERAGSRSKKVVTAQAPGVDRERSEEFFRYRKEATQARTAHVNLMKQKARRYAQLMERKRSRRSIEQFSEEENEKMEEELALLNAKGCVECGRSFSLLSKRKKYQCSCCRREFCLRCLQEIEVYSTEQQPHPSSSGALSPRSPRGSDDDSERKSWRSQVSAILHRKTSTEDKLNTKVNPQISDGIQTNSSDAQAAQPEGAVVIGTPIDVTEIEPKMVLVLCCRECAPLAERLRRSQVRARNMRYVQATNAFLANYAMLVELRNKCSDLLDKHEDLVRTIKARGAESTTAKLHQMTLDCEEELIAALQVYKVTFNAVLDGLPKHSERWLLLKDHLTRSFIEIITERTPAFREQQEFARRVQLGATRNVYVFMYNLLMQLRVRRAFWAKHCNAFMSALKMVEDELHADIVACHEEWSAWKTSIDQFIINAPTDLLGIDARLNPDPEVDPTTPDGIRSDPNWNTFSTHEQTFLTIATATRAALLATEATLDATVAASALPQSRTACSR